MKCDQRFNRRAIRFVTGKFRDRHEVVLCKIKMLAHPGLDHVGAAWCGAAGELAMGHKGY